MSASENRSASRRRGAAGVPAVAAPDDLVAWRLDAGGEAFALLEWRGPALRAPPLGPALSPAEEAVALLAARGRSNREIAALRGTSARTVANQLARVFAKLGVGSRAGLCALLSASGEDAP